MTTQFSFAGVPAPGMYSLRAIANGIASNPVNLTVALTVNTPTRDQWRHRVHRSD